MLSGTGIENLMMLIEMKMKAIVLMICGLVSVGAFAQNPAQNGSRYCATLKDGIVVVTHSDEVITEDAWLKDSSRVTKTGVIIKKDGNKIMLREGQCVDADGNVLVSREMRNSEDKIADKKKKK